VQPVGVGSDHRDVVQAVEQHRPRIAPVRPASVRVRRIGAGGAADTALRLLRIKGTGTPTTAKRDETLIRPISGRGSKVIGWPSTSG